MLIHGVNEFSVILGKPLIDMLAGSDAILLIRSYPSLARYQRCYRCLVAKEYDCPVVQREFCLIGSEFVDFHGFLRFYHGLIATH